MRVSDRDIVLGRLDRMSPHLSVRDGSSVQWYVWRVTIDGWNFDVRSRLQLQDRHHRDWGMVTMRCRYYFCDGGASFSGCLCSMDIHLPVAVPPLDPCLFNIIMHGEDPFNNDHWRMN